MFNLNNRETWIIVGTLPDHRVYVGNNELVPGNSLKHVNHSPDGFNWGYRGSGAAQLSFALLLELFGPSVAKSLYQRFKEDFVARWPADLDFTTDLESIWRWMLRNCQPPYSVKPGTFPEDMGVRRIVLTDPVCGEWVINGETRPGDDM